MAVTFPAMNPYLEQDDVWLLSDDRTLAALMPHVRRLDFLADTC